MALAIGNNAVKGAYLGANQVRRAYDGGTLVYQGFGPASEQEFIQQEATGGPAQLLKCFGKTIVNNQLVNPSYWPSGTNGGIIFTNNGDGTYTADGTASALATRVASNVVSVVSGHKYLLLGSNASGDFRLNIWNATLFGLSSKNAPEIAEAIGSGVIDTFRLVVTQGAFIDNETIRPLFIDLTLRFGAGNEPTSVDEALRLLGGDAFDPTYDPGSLQSNKTSLLRAERVPVINVWDEEWESGYITSTGVKAPDPTSLRSTNYIAISGGQNYYCKIPRGAVRICWYTSEKVFISKSDALANTYITAPNEARYILFYANSQYGTTYSHDICINLSDPAINGHYFPHWRGSLALNLSTLTGKLNGEGASVVVYPDGLRGVGTNRDAAYGSTGEVRIGQVDLGTLNWHYTTSSSLGAHFYAILSPAAKNDNRGVLPLCAKYQGVTAVSRYFSQDDKVISIEDGTRVRIWDSAYTDAAIFKTAMSGVELYYPLATPLTYTLDTPLPTDLTCEQGDILQRVSDNNCPFVGEMKFGL